MTLKFYNVLEGVEIHVPAISSTSVQQFTCYRAHKLSALYHNGEKSGNEGGPVTMEVDPWPWKSMGFVQLPWHLTLPYLTFGVGRLLPCLALPCLALPCLALPYLTLPYLTLPLGWAGCYTCPALRPYQFGPMRSPDVTKGHSHRLWSWTNHQPPGTGDV